MRAQVLSCTSCELVSRCSAPVPFSGPTPAVLAVVGEAPGKTEDEQGKPFVGPAGELLRRLLYGGGFDPDQIFYCNAANCFPVDFQGKGRAPNDTEVKACSDNLRVQMEVSEAKYFLLVGGVALKAVRPGLKISKARGVPFLLGSTKERIGDKLALPTWHPSYVLRMGQDGKAADQVVEDLAYLRRLMEAGPGGWTALFPETCVLCGEWSERFDDDGVGFCDSCWTSRGK